MLRLIIVLLFLFFAIWLGLQVAWHPGYLVLFAHPWLVQMPLWFGILCVLVFLILFYYLISGIDYVHLLKLRFKNWRHIRKEQKAASRTQRGMIALNENQWQKAEKWLLAGLSQSGEPLSHYFALAKAAERQGAFQKRDHYLKMASQLVPAATLATELVKAEMLIEEIKFDEALAILMPIKQKVPTHPKLLSLLQHIYLKTEDNEKLFQLIPLMRKAKLYPAPVLTELEITEACDMLYYADEKSVTEIKAMWQSLPRYLRHNPNIMSSYAQQLNKHVKMNDDLVSEIKELIRDVLKKKWDAELVLLYGSYSFQNLDRELVLLGKWLKMYGEQQSLLFVLGKFCSELKLWGRAKDYFEKCLAKGPYPAASFAYGKLLERLSEEEKALRVYQSGLEDLA